MEHETLALSGLILITPRVFSDERGYFFESYQKDRYREIGIPVDDFVQDNSSLSRRGVLRGLHFQRAPQAQGKLVQVLRGKVFDVVVDIRPDSPTFGKHEGLILSEENHHQLWIPGGFAHGFVALSDDTIFTYKVTAPYSPEHDGGIRYDDPALGIVWPLSSDELVVSEKDRTLPLMKDIFHR